MDRPYILPPSLRQDSGRVYQAPVDAHFQVNVGSGGKTGAAHCGNCLPGGNVVAPLYIKLASVTVGRFQTVAMIKENVITVAISSRQTQQRHHWLP